MVLDTARVDLELDRILILSPVNGLNMRQRRRRSRMIFRWRFHAVAAVRALHRRYKSWRKVADVIGAYSPGYWCGVATHRFGISEAARDAVRFHYHLAPRRAKGEIKRMRPGDLARYLRHRQPATYPPCVELWR